MLNMIILIYMESLKYYKLRISALNFTLLSIIIIICTAFLTGISRTAIPGIGILLPTLVAITMPARESTGFLLPILIMADLMAVIHFRHTVVWQRLLKILPWTSIGILLGYFIMGLINDSIFKPILGSMIIIFVTIDLIRRKSGIRVSQKNIIFSAIMGCLAGVFTMIANAAGPIMTIYLLSMDLGKDDFVGTNAWFFMIINLIKLPFSASLGLITWNGLKIDFMFAPLIIFGEIIGSIIVKKISQKNFDILAQVLAAIAGFRLFF